MNGNQLLAKHFPEHDELIEKLHTVFHNPGSKMPVSYEKLCKAVVLHGREIGFWPNFEVAFSDSERQGNYAKVEQYLADFLGEVRNGGLSSPNDEQNFLAMTAYRVLGSFSRQFRRIRGF